MIKITRNQLTQNLLKEYLSYCPNTGKFTWIKNTHPYKNLVGKEAGSISKRDGHIELRFLGTLYRASTLAWLYMYGKFPNYHIDHQDHNEQNNAISNLRDVPQKENNKNQSKKISNTSGVTGVWINKKSSINPYVAEIMVNKRKISLGSFPALASAAQARKHAESLYGFHHNHGISKPH